MASRTTSGHAREERLRVTTSAEERGRERHRRIREKGDDITDKARGGVWIVGGILFAVLAIVGGVLPLIFSGLLQGTAWALAAAAGGMGAIAIWLRRSSDEPGEKVGWLIIAAIAISALVFWVGGM